MKSQSKVFHKNVLVSQTEVCFIVRLLEDLQLAIAEIFFCVHQLFQSGIVDDFQVEFFLNPSVM